MADAKLSELTELAATPANDDELYIRDVSEAAVAESKRITAANLMAGQAKITSGQYTGNDGVNRAVAHGLGVAPKFVFITRNNSAALFFTIVAGLAQIHQFASGTNSLLAVTAGTTTNFYVGNATSYTNSANADAIVYDWVAIG